MRNGKAKSFRIRRADMEIAAPAEYIRHYFNDLHRVAAEPLIIALQKLIKKETLDIADMLDGLAKQSHDDIFVQRALLSAAVSVRARVKD